MLSPWHVYNPAAVQYDDTLNLFDQKLKQALPICRYPRPFDTEQFVYKKLPGQTIAAWSLGALGFLGAKEEQKREHETRITANQEAAGYTDTPPEPEDLDDDDDSAGPPWGSILMKTCW
ncbi:hypothetical protein MMC08_001305 [Hypocenomyce scalaris]|nr:hypothetical protein [Hypocenomyce scalaris]